MPPVERRRPAPMAQPAPGMQGTADRPLRAVRAGFTLAELIVVMTLLSLLAALFFGALTLQLRLARATALRTLDNDAVRTVTNVLGGELRRARITDLRAVSADSVALRAFRGIATVCDTAGGHIEVYYRGDRAPDPAKDSVLWLGGGGAQVAFALSSATTPLASTCRGPGPGQPQTWRTSAPLPGRGVLLLFESGNYYLTTQALRYRLGAEGRQPLTATLFADATTGFAQPAPTVIEIQLGLGSAPAHPLRTAAYFSADSL